MGTPSQGFESPSRHPYHFTILVTEHFFHLPPTGPLWRVQRRAPGYAAPEDGMLDAGLGAGIITKQQWVLRTKEPVR